MRRQTDKDQEGKWRKEDWGGGGTYSPKGHKRQRSFPQEAGFSPMSSAESIAAKDTGQKDNSCA